MNSIPEKKGEIVIYQEDDGKTDIFFTLYQESLWLSLNQIAELFGRDKSVISRHLRKVFHDGELNREATVAFFATVQNEGGRSVERRVEYFNLDVILSVGYRVNSKLGTLSLFSQQEWHVVSSGQDNFDRWEYPCIDYADDC